MKLARVGVVSTGLTIGALYAILGLFLGGIFSLGALTAGGLAGAAGEELGLGIAGGALFGVGAVIFFPLLYGVLGTIMGFIIALIYNLTAKMTGGIKMEFVQSD